MKTPTPFSSLAYSFEFERTEFSRRCLFPHEAKLDFCQQPFFSRPDRIAAMFSKNLAPELADLAEVAVSVYFADRFAPRRHPEHPDSCVIQRRRIRMSVCVRNPKLWNGEPRDVIHELLWFLTGDEWEVNFKAQNDSVQGEQQFLLDFVLPKPARVMLFSGGLDSYAGAIHQLEDNEHFHVLVSGSTHNRMAAGQRLQVGGLLNRNQGQGEHVVVPYGLPQKLDGLHLESSQRTRGFVHLSFGAIGARHLDAADLFVYENGVGALNLPFDATQAGAEVSRAVHPKTLLLVEELMTAVGHQSFVIRTPFQFITKAEALIHSRTPQSVQGIRETFSCDRFPNYRERTRQCGVCSSCVLRRLSLEAAGLNHVEAAGDYSHDITSGDCVLKPSAAFILEKFDAQAHRLSRAFAAENPWQRLIHLYPELREVEYLLTRRGHASSDVQSGLGELYRNHVSQWQRFSGRDALRRYLAA
jgi:hypothetical protein